MKVIQAGQFAGAKNANPTIFTTYNISTDLFNKRVKYLSLDQKSAIVYNNEKKEGREIGWHIRSWIDPQICLPSVPSSCRKIKWINITEFFSEDSMTNAYTEDNVMCPHQTGQTWEYWNAIANRWKEAGDGLEVVCTGQCFQSVKRDR